MTRTLTITLKDEVYFNEKFSEILKKKKVSSTIDKLLKEYLEIKEDDILKSKDKLEEELNSINAKKLELKEKLDKIKTLEQEELNRYVIIQ